MIYLEGYQQTATCGVMHQDYMSAQKQIRNLLPLSGHG